MLYFEVQNCEEFERLTCTPIFLRTVWPDGLSNQEIPATVEIPAASYEHYRL